MIQQIFVLIYQPDISFHNFVNNISNNYQPITQLSPQAQVHIATFLAKLMESNYSSCYDINDLQMCQNYLQSLTQNHFTDQQYEYLINLHQLISNQIQQLTSPQQYVPQYSPPSNHHIPPFRLNPRALNRAHVPNQINYNQQKIIQALNRQQINRLTPDLQANLPQKNNIKLSNNPRVINIQNPMHQISDPQNTYTLAYTDHNSDTINHMKIDIHTMIKDKLSTDNIANDFIENSIMCPIKLEIKLPNSNLTAVMHVRVISTEPFMCLWDFGKNNKNAGKIGVVAGNNTHWIVGGGSPQGTAGASKQVSRFANFAYMGGKMVGQSIKFVGNSTKSTEHVEYEELKALQRMQWIFRDTENKPQLKKWMFENDYFPLAAFTRTHKHASKAADTKGRTMIHSISIFGDGDLTVLQKQNTSNQKKIDVCCQITNQLIGFHFMGLIHRDIKPTNIVYKESTGKARIIDFGTVNDQEHLNEKHNASNMTITGTPNYLGADLKKAYSQPAPNEGCGKYNPYANDLESLLHTMMELFYIQHNFLDINNLNQLLHIFQNNLNNSVDQTAVEAIIYTINTYISYVDQQSKKLETSPPVNAIKQLELNVANYLGIPTN